MAKTVDQRIVEMKLDNSKLKQPAEETIGILGRLKQALSFTDATSGLSKVSSELQKVKMEPLQAGIEGVTKGFSAMEQIAVGALRQVGSSIASTAAGLVKQFALDPILSGLNEYQAKMDSIKVTMANTGEPLEKVKASLEELNLYADKTIYSFGDMTKSIGLFTAQGVKLDDAVQAIQGVSNLAAVTGAGANEASRAMFNFAQALSAGKMTLIDWKTMQNTGMGNDRFRAELIQTAKDLGYLNKEFSYGKNQTISGMDALAEASEHFTETLKYGWVDNNVMIETLRRYSSEEYEIGRMANKAATEVNTFAKLMDSTGEAIQSSWGMIWELIIGDYEESTKLWTSISDSLGSAINNAFDGPTQTLKEWRALGGREDFLQGLANSIKLVSSLLDPFQKAFERTFKPITGQQLAEASSKFADFTSRIKISSEASYGLSKAFEGTLSVIKLFGNGIKIALDILSPLAQVINVAAGYVVTFSGKMGSAVTKMVEWSQKSEGLKKSVEGLKQIVQSISTALIDLMNGTKGAGEIFSTMATGIGEGLAKALGGASEHIRSFTTDFLHLDKILAGVKAFSLGDLFSFGSDAIETGKQVVKDFVKGFTSSDVKMEVPDAFTSAFETLKKLFSGLSSYNVEDTFASIKDGCDKALQGIDPLTSRLGGLVDYLGGGVRDVIDWLREELKTLSFDDVKDAIEVGFLAKLSVALSNFFNNLAGLVDIGDSVNDVLGGVKDVLKAYQSQIKYDNLVKIATAIGILAASVTALALLPTDKMLAATAGLGIIATELAAFTFAMSKIADSSKNFESIGKLSTTYIALGAALVIMAGAVKKLGSLDFDQMAQGLTGLGVVIVELVAFGKQMDQVKLDPKTISMITALSTSVTLLMVPLKLLGGMDLASLSQGVIALGALLLELSVSLRAMDEVDLTKTSGGLLALSTALVPFGAAVAIFGSMELETLAQGLIGLGVALAELVIAVKALEGTTGGTTAMLALAAALALLTPEIAILGNLELETLAKGLIALGVALAEMLAAGAVAQMVAPGLIALSTAITGLGTAILAGGAGFAAFTLGMNLLMGAFEKFGKMSDTTIKGISNNITTFVAELLTGAVALKGKFAEALLAIIQSLVDALEKGAPDIAHGVLVIITELLALLEEYAPQIVDSVINIVVDIINGLAERTDDIVDAGFNLIFSFFNAIVDAIDKYLGIDLDAMADAGFKMVKSLFDSVKEWIDKKINDIRGWFKDVKDAALGALGIGGNKNEFEKAGKDVANGLAHGIDSNLDAVRKSSYNAGRVVVDEARKAVDAHSDSQEMIAVGKDSANGLAHGFFDWMTGDSNRKSITDGVKDMLNQVKKTFTGEDAEETKESAKEAGEGTANAYSDGVEAGTPRVKESSKNIGSEMKSSVKEGADAEKTGEEIAEELDKALVKALETYESDLEAIARDRAERLKNIFSEELSSLDMGMKTLDLEYKLWEATGGRDESEFVKVQKKIELMTNKLYSLDDAYMYAKGNYDAAVQEFGASSVEAKASYQEMLQAELDFREQANEIQDTQNEFNKKQIEGRKKYNDYIDEQLKLLAEGKSKFTDMADMYEEAKKQSGYDPDMYWEELTNDVEAIVKKSLEMVDKYYKAETQKKLEEINKEYDGLASEAMQTFVDTMMEHEPNVQEATEDLMDAGLEAAESKIPEWLGAGKDLAVEVGKGIEQNKTKTEQPAKNLSNAGVSAINATASMWGTAGGNVVGGFIKGMEAQFERARSAGRGLANAAYSGTMSQLRAHSPSRLFMESGGFVPSGFAIGIENGADRVKSAGRAMVDAVSQAVAYAEEDLMNQVDMSPTITPTVDMSQIRGSIKSLNSIFADYMPTAVANVRVVQADIDRASKINETLNTPVQQVTNNYQYDYVQNNTSPKALSTYDIYRQTKNLFAKTKERSSI